MEVSLLVLFQVGAMVTYMLDAMRYREGALGAIWVTLGSVNLSIWVSGALFMGHRPFIMSFMIGICSGISLFITGSALGTSFPLPIPLYIRTCFLRTLRRLALKRMLN